MQFTLHDDGYLTFDYIKLFFHLFIENHRIVDSVGRRISRNQKWEHHFYIDNAIKNAKVWMSVLLLEYCFKLKDLNPIIISTETYELDILL
jgi:hypothetical protein